MKPDRKNLGRLVRMAALALALTMAGAGAWPACDGSNSSNAVSADVDPGPTFGLEVTVAIRGRGRVVSEPTALDCPGNCFARITLADRNVDGSAEGLSLSVRASLGSHFVGWSYEAMDVGIRARGPAQCSPMTRSTSVLPAPSSTQLLSLSFGETAGTPPAGREAECADFTRVPLAYAVTATFEENTVTPPRPVKPGPPVEVLFEPPTLGVVTAKDIGITGGRVYWVFEKQGFGSGIASGLVDGSGGGSTVHVAPSGGIQRFHVDKHVAFQHGQQAQYGYLEVIQSGATTVRSLGYNPPCGALATDDAYAYCRVFNGIGITSYMYLIPILGGTTTYLSPMPPGNDLTLDEQYFYFSEDRGGAPGQAIIESTPRSSEGGGVPPVISKLVYNQTVPRELRVSNDHLFWLDDQSGSFVSANTASIFGTDGGSPVMRGMSSARFLVVDPSAPTTFYIGVSSSSRNGDSYIVKASALSGVVTSFRSGLTGIGGIAVDATHVFWTQNDGRVYRAPKD